MDFKLGLKKQFKVASTLRKQAERYMSSREPYDVRQGETLSNMADDIMSNDLDSARLRFDSLHANIRGSLPFDVLDHIDRVEHHAR